MRVLLLQVLALLIMSGARGRPVGSKTTNRSGARTGPKGPRQPKLGPPVRTNPWSVPDATGPSSVQQGAGAGARDGSVGAGFAKEAAAPSAPQPSGAIEVPNAHVVNALFALEPEAETAGSAMDILIEDVKRTVDSRTTRKGHGVKHGVEGFLEGGSPWFNPDDPIHSRIPDRRIHWMTPVYVCVWEYLDKDIKAPPCPFCESSEHVSWVVILSYKLASTSYTTAVLVV